MLKFIIGSIFISIFTFGHGENIPGPNGGFIKMPGAFHTELKLEKRGIRIWLLDIDFKNPIVFESSVNLNIFETKKNKSTLVKCTPEKEYFICKTKLNLNEIKSIKVNATRSHQKGIEMEYLFPLKSPENKQSHH